MSSQWISAALRAEVRQRAAGCCEYCRVHAEDVGAPHEPDHIIAEQHGGKTTAENLALACYHCNRHKGTNIESVDPQTRQPAFLFHPRQDQWTDHFKVEGARIVSLTAKARATAALLKFNAPDRLETRQMLARAGQFPV